jgi:drug/metabolite transporter (DMT)-like permease
MTRAYRLGDTLTVGTLAYSNVAFSAGYGVVLFGDRLPLGAWLGMALIVAAGIISVRAARAAAPAE